MELKEGDKISVDVLAHIVDHQDGGGSTRLYANKRHFILSLIKDAGISYTEAEEKYNEIEDENDPYENGEFDTKTLEFVVRNGKLELASSKYFNWGQ